MTRKQKRSQGKGTVRRLQPATLADYQNSLETDGTPTDHVQREASQLFGNRYGSVTSKRKLQAGKKLWLMRLTHLKRHEARR